MPPELGYPVMNEPSLKQDLLVLVPLFFATWVALLRFARKKDAASTLRGPSSHALALLRLALIFGCFEWYAMEFKISFAFFIGILTLFYVMVWAGATATAPALCPDWIGVMAVGFAFCLYQWVFWFPVVDELTSKSSIGGAPESPPSRLIGKLGICATPLRPFGRAAVENEEYEAKSELNYVDANARIEVVAVKDSNLIVREI